MAAPQGPPLRRAARRGPPPAHSSQYRDPGSVDPGPVLVVGAGTAGADIALELSATHDVRLAGPEVGHVPLAVIRSRVLRRLLHGRRLPATRAGDAFADALRRRLSPLVWQRERDLARAGIERVGRITGARDGYPVLADGRSHPVSTVVWCTGARPDHGWLAPAALGPDGRVTQRRGLSRSLPGTAVVGLPFQCTLSSGFLPGMAADAEDVVRGLAAER